MVQTRRFMHIITKFFMVAGLFMATNSFAQQQDNFSYEKAASINLSELPPSWHPKVFSIEAPYPGSDSYRNYLHQLKLLRYGDRNISTVANKEKKVAASNPIYDLGFNANFYGGRPNDNDIAISNDGKVVSVSNSELFVYDDLGNELIEVALSDFADSLSLTAHSYDPKVIYDPNEDRFILAFLNGSDEAATAIVVCFSQSNDPTQGWNIYSLDGNPFNNQAWSDFPMIAMTNQDFFVTVNHIHSDSASWQTGFMQSVIWQVQKSEGYNGGTITTKLHSNVEYANKPIRNLLPVHGGFDLKDDEMYFISNRNFDNTNDTFFLVKIEEPLVQNANPSFTVNVVKSNQNYGLPPDAQQTATTFLQTNDARALSGLIENGIIHFVGNTVDFTTDLASIYHGRLNVLDPNPTVELEILSDNAIEYGYPNLSFTGQSPFDEQLIISFNHASIDSFPGISAIYYNKAEGYSDRLHLKSGNTNVNVVQGDYERWGDYTGNQKKYNEPGVVWINGFIGHKNSFASSPNQHKTYVAKLTSPDLNATGIQADLNLSSKLYPNPVRESFSLEFDLETSALVDFKIYDVQGKLVHHLMQRHLKAGKNSAFFSTENLQRGMYFLELTDSSNQSLLRTQIIKN